MRSLMRAVTFDCTVWSSAAARFMLPFRATDSKMRRPEASIAGLAIGNEDRGYHIKSPQDAAHLVKLQAVKTGRDTLHGGCGGAGAARASSRTASLTGAVL